MDLLVDTVYVGKIRRNEWSIKPSPLLFEPSSYFKGLEELELHEAVKQAMIRKQYERIDSLYAQNKELKGKINANEDRILEIRREIEEMIA